MDILVKTSIDPTKIQFAQQYPSAVVVIDVLNEDYDFVFIIEVLDKNDIGVPGKYPSQIIISTLNESQHNNIEISILDEHDLFDASKIDGVMTIPVKVIKLLDTTVANITLVIDGFNITTTYIEFYLAENIDENAIAKVEFSELPIDDFERGISINQMFIVKAEAYNLYGHKLKFRDYNIKADIYFDPKCQAQIPEDYYIFDCTSYISGTEVTFE